MTRPGPVQKTRVDVADSLATKKYRVWVRRVEIVNCKASLTNAPGEVHDQTVSDQSRKWSVVKKTRAAQQTTEARSRMAQGDSGTEAGHGITTTAGNLERWGRAKWRGQESNQ